MAFAHPTPATAQAVVIISNAPVTFTNNNDCAFLGTCAAITTLGTGAFIDFTNTGNFTVVGPFASGIVTTTTFGFSRIDLTNSGNIATTAIGAYGITATTFGQRSPISIVNSGDISTLGLRAHGIFSNTLGSNSNLSITNSGRVTTRGHYAAGLFGRTAGPNSQLSITNSGDITTRGINAYGIFGYTGCCNADLTITNSGSVSTTGRNADSIFGFTYGPNSGISITNSGELSTIGRRADGIYAMTVDRGSDLTITNSGRIETRGAYAAGVNASSYGSGSDIHIANKGDIKTSGSYSAGIYSSTNGRNSSLTIQNSGSITTQGILGFGIYAQTFGASSPLTIDNSGHIYGTTAGLDLYSATSTKIVNSGEISAGSGLAIDTEGASTTIENTGLITGFVDLTDSADRFVNQAGGEFRATDTSDFRGGSDVFINEAGGTLRAASDATESEETRFVDLERFENAGLITLVDGKNNDVFRISNTVGGTDHTFVGKDGSTLAVDAFLGGPGSRADNLIIEGNARGKTRIAVHNTNTSSARFDPVGIPVVFVDGDVDASNFYIDKPIDAGFFDYDLFFVPTGSGFFELKNHTGGGSHLLPQLVTVTHETFHNATQTWFDQSTDLRVLLARGNLCDDPGRSQDVVRCQELYNFTPGVWARGAGSWFEIEDSATTKANGRTYRHDLKRDLDIWQIESGIDFGKRDLFADGDILVVGVLGGAVETTLNYDAIIRRFEMSSLEAGAYATYLRGGLFVDTLFKTIFSEIDTSEVRGFPESLDSTTYGFRTDAGYRFGGLRPGPFIEPLATIAVSWTHIDDFARDGNAIDFDDDEDVRGRLGLRVGTSSEVWEGTTMEPFVVGSLWGNLSGDHNATLTSTGRIFRLVDEPDDVWGEVSAGVNFFNPGAQTALFAKADYVFGDETQGVSLRGGMRYNW